MKETVLVTGSSRGIGRAVALKFASCGYHVVINCARSTERMEEVKKEVSENKGIQINIDQEKIDKYVNETKQHLGISLKFLVEFMKKPLSTTMYSQISNSVGMFFVVLQVLAFLTLEIVVVANIYKIMTDLFGPLAYWLDLRNTTVYGAMYLKGTLIVILSVLMLVVLMNVVVKKLGNAIVTKQRIMSIAIISTIPITLSFVLGAVIMSILPILALVILIIGFISSVVLGSHSLLGNMETNKDKGIYMIFGVYLVQIIMMSIIIKVCIGL